MKKTIVELCLVVFLLVCILGGTVQAATCRITLETSKTQFTKNEQVVVNFNMSEYRTSKGIATLLATLEYDTNSLKLEKLEGQNGWTTPSYNEENKTFFMDKNSNVTQNETFLKATFTVTANTNKNLTISLKDITVSEGAGDVEVNNASKNITIGTQSSGNTGNSNNGNNSGNNSSNSNNNNNSNKNDDENEGTLNIIGNNEQTTGSNTNQNSGTKGNNIDGSTANGKLPQTGSNNVILTVATVGAISVAAVFFVKLKIIIKNMK